MFSQDSINFIRELSTHNERPWFEENKTRYLSYVKEAAAQFSDGLCPILAARYDTQVSGKLFRIHRDLRFSKDKTPYNAHIHMSFSDARTGAAWMVGLEPNRLVLGYGVFGFDKRQLKSWRNVVSGPAGHVLRDLLTGAILTGLTLDTPALKRVPAPYPSNHPNGELLRHKGIALWSTALPQNRALGDGAAEQVAAALCAFDPLRDWMTAELPA